jgi:hypothetical protein
MPKLEIEVSESELKKLKGGNQNAGPIKIVILQRGWVFVGRLSKTGSDCVLEDASCIRVWGTTRGLGELTEAPTSKTVLDKTGTVRFHELTVIATLDCSQTAWESKC